MDTTKQVLVAGIGNIFLGDDGFGCEVIRELSQRRLTEALCVRDFGIRSYDLAYALTEGFAAVILVDSAPRGQTPGTLYVIEPDLAQLDRIESGPVDAHSLDPVRVLQMAALLGARVARLYLVGCEPAPLETEEGRLGLSAEVRTAVPKAIELIESLAGELLNKNQDIESGLMPV